MRARVHVLRPRPHLRVTGGMRLVYRGARTHTTSAPRRCGGEEPTSPRGMPSLGAPPAPTAHRKAGRCGGGWGERGRGRGRGPNPDQTEGGGGGGKRFAGNQATPAPPPPRYPRCHSNTIAGARCKCSHGTGCLAGGGGGEEGNPSDATHLTAPSNMPVLKPNPCPMSASMRSPSVSLVTAVSSMEGLCATNNRQVQVSCTRDVGAASALVQHEEPLRHAD